MENLINRFVLDVMIDNDYQLNWLRRITRQTKTQYIADVQYIIDFKNNLPRYKVSNHCAKRYKLIKGVLKPIDKQYYYNHLNDITLINNFDILLCSFKYEELFKNIIPVYVENIDDETVNYLKIFNKPIYQIYDFMGDIDTINGFTIFSKSAIHFHINHFGGNKDIRTTLENRPNKTISFWLFEDKLVFKLEYGINTW